MFPVLPPQPVVPISSGHLEFIATTSPIALANTTSGKVAAQVPFYSQFADISSAKWKKVGCGITSLAMVIDYYQPGAVSVNTLLSEGVAAGAYMKSAGWTYAGLIQVSRKYGMTGKTRDLQGESRDEAFAEMKDELRSGPVIASVHYKFDPQNPIPHLVVITAIDGDTVHYNDPAAKNGDKSIDARQFLKAWKKRYIVIRPAQEA